MTADHDFIWKHLPERRKRLHGATRLVGLIRHNKGVWVTFQEVTPAELSILRAFATAAESKHQRLVKSQIERQTERRSKRR